MIKYIKPPLVLMIITAVTVGLLIGVHELTYVDKSGDVSYLTDDCIELLGDDSYSLSDFTFDGVYKTIIGDKKSGVAFEVITKGYNSDGIDVLVAIKDGEVLGVRPVSISETPGLGTNVENESFLSQFVGKSTQLSVAKSATKDNEISAYTGATKSSRGVTNAVNTALNAYNSAKEAGIVE